jgi:hypothetical protein
MHFAALLRGVRCIDQFKPVMIQECPHCHRKVLPRRDDTCPSCSKNVLDVKDVDLNRSALDFTFGVKMPECCHQCGVFTRNRQAMRLNSGTRPPVESRILTHAIAHLIPGLGMLLRARDEERHPSEFVQMNLEIPTCDTCTAEIYRKGPGIEASYMDLLERRVTVIVHKDFKREFLKLNSRPTSES